jgi:hypothetical protein
MPAGAIDWGALVQVVWASFVAGVAMTAVFSLVILASARATEYGRAGRRGSALAFAVLAALGLAVFALGIALGVRAMLTK